MAIEKTDTKRLTSLHRTNGISEDVLKKLNLAVKKQINEHNSDLKKINENKRKGDQDELKKLENKIRTFIVSIENGDLVKKIILDLTDEEIKQIEGSSQNFSDIKNNVDLGQADVVIKKRNYTQILIEKSYQLNQNKINVYKNVSPFLRKKLMGGL